MRQTEEQLEDIKVDLVVGSKQKVEEVFKEMEQIIKLPWTSQANKLRRHTAANWNQKFLKLLAREKLLYEGMKWKSKRSNSTAYKEV